jgi:hypothetical protein
VLLLRVQERVLYGGCRRTCRVVGAARLRGQTSR